jgi:Endomembrane protein 70
MTDPLSSITSFCFTATVCAFKSNNHGTCCCAQAAAFLTATLYPGLVFAVGIFINFFIWGKHSSGAIPFTTMLSVGAMWFCISLPLVYIGYFFGYRKQPYEHPVRTNQIPRQVRRLANQKRPFLCFSLTRGFHVVLHIPAPRLHQLLLRLSQAAL